MASGSEIEEISMDDLERQANPPSRALSWKSIRVPTIVVGGSYLDPRGSL